MVRIGRLKVTELVILLLVRSSDGLSSLVVATTMDSVKDVTCRREAEVLSIDSVRPHWAREEDHGGLPSMPIPPTQVVRSPERYSELLAQGALPQTVLRLGVGNTSINQPRWKRGVGNASFDVFVGLDEEKNGPSVETIAAYIGHITLSVIGCLMLCACCVVCISNCDSHMEWREWLLWHSSSYQEVAEEEKKEAEVHHHHGDERHHIRKKSKQQRGEETGDVRRDSKESDVRAKSKGGFLLVEGEHARTKSKPQG
jgi:hypothetical protein